MYSHFSGPMLQEVCLTQWIGVANINTHISFCCGFNGFPRESCLHNALTMGHLSRIPASIQKQENGYRRCTRSHSPSGIDMPSQMYPHRVLGCSVPGEPEYGLTISPLVLLAAVTMIGPSCALFLRRLWRFPPRVLLAPHCPHQDLLAVGTVIQSLLGALPYLPKHLHGEGVSLL